MLTLINGFKPLKELVTEGFYCAAGALLQIRTNETAITHCVNLRKELCLEVAN